MKNMNGIADRNCLQNNERWSFLKCLWQLLALFEITDAYIRCPYYREAKDAIISVPTEKRSKMRTTKYSNDIFFCIVVVDILSSVQTKIS